MKLTLHEIARHIVVQNDVTVYPDYQLQNIEFDSRKISPGDLFLPLRGNRNGHDFIEVALKKGALATFSEKPLETPHLLVDDCLTAFQQLSKYYLEKMQVDVIAVTGSNGKTTTKDMIHRLLATTYKTYKTQGNYNNEIGLPYTICHMPEDTEKLVLEMGQDRLGDIQLLSEIAKPNIAVVTLIGEAHLEFFGTRDKIAQGKLQIADGMDRKGLLLVPDDPIISPYLPTEQQIVTFGESADLYLVDLVEAKDSLSFKTNFLELSLTLPVTGKYNATNAMLAAYVATVCGISQEKIKEALSQMVLSRNRTEWKTAKNGADILSDVYNANPTAMHLILETFSSIPRNAGGQKIVLLADMKELGPDSLKMHADLYHALTNELDAIFLYGTDIKTLADYLAEDPRVKYYVETEQFDQLKRDLNAKLQAKDQILIKGSRSMKLDEVVEDLEGLS